MAITYHAGRRIQGGATTSTVATSSTGTTGNATNNGSGFTATTGLFGAGMSQASGNYKMTNEPVLGNSWSFNFWCIPQAASGNDYFMQMDSDSGTTTSAFYMYNHSSLGLNMSVYDSTGVALATDSSNNAMWLAMTNGSWNMITIVWDNSAKQLRTYKNGVLYGTSKTWTHSNAGNMAASNKDWYMLNYNSETAANGYSSRASNLDEWSWWSGTLSQADITALYNSGTGIKASDITGTNRTKLMVYYDFQDSPNGTLTNQAPTTTQSTVLDTKPTNVQLGSRFEDTYSRKIHHYDAQTSTFEDDFSTDKSWVHLNSSTTLDTGNGYLTFTDPSSSIVYAYKNLQDSDALGAGNFPDTDFVIRAEVEKTNNPTSTGNGSQVEIVLTDSLATGWGNNQDQIGIFWNVDHVSSEGEFRAIGADNTNTYSSWSSATALVWNSGTWFIEIIKNGSSSVDVKIFPDNTYSGTATATATLSLSGMTFSALQYLQVRIFADSSRATTLYHIKNMYYYDGVTTVPTGNAWTEEGT